MKHADEEPREFEDAGEENQEPIDRDEYREEMFRALVRDILSPEDKKRYAALQLIRYFECDPRLTSYLTSLLHDSNVTRVRDGIEGLGEWAHSDGTSLLINFLTAADNADRIDVDMEQQILVAFGKIGGLDALQFLTHYTLNRFGEQTEVADDLGMTGVEAIARIASMGHPQGVEFLLKGCSHDSWNMREACADALGLVYGGRESVPQPVYDTLLRLSQDNNKDVRIAAFMSLDDIVGLDEGNRALLNEARQKQISRDDT